MKKLSYRDVHWGVPPTAELTTRIFDYADQPVHAVGRCVAISYRSQKGGTWKSYRHAFTRRPLLLVSGGNDRVVCARDMPKGAMSVGILIDIELESGERHVAPGYLVVTDEYGQSVWLAALGNRPKVALEQLQKGPNVTVHGIEN